MAADAAECGCWSQIGGDQSPLEAEPCKNILNIFSSRFEGLAERIDALEHQVAELKSQREHSSGVVATKAVMVDESTMVGQPFFLSTLPNSTKLTSFADILSLETKDCFSAGHDEGDSPPWLGTSLLQLRVKQELESIYEISLQNLSKGKLSDITAKYSPTSSQVHDLNVI